MFKKSPDCEFFDQQNVIYRVNCNGCQKCYVGQTRRKVRCRLKDHKNAIKWNKEDSAIALHVRNCGHHVDPFNADIIHEYLLFCNSSFNPVSPDLVKEAPHGHSQQGCCLCTVPPGFFQGLDNGAALSVFNNIFQGPDLS